MILDRSEICNDVIITVCIIVGYSFIGTISSPAFVYSRYLVDENFKLVCSSQLVLTSCSAILWTRLDTTLLIRIRNWSVEVIVVIITAV